ncbi:MAG: FecR domain-containing protein [Agriterribacter sp.]
MQPDPEQLRILAGKYINGTATDEEKALLHQWYEEMHAGDTELIISSSAKDTTAFGEAALTELKQMIAEDHHNFETPVKRMRWWRIAAAAVLLLSIGVAVYLIPRKSSAPPVAAQEKKPETKDVAPPSATKAVLTLSGGKTIVLDDAANGDLATQGNTKIIKKAGDQLDYTVTGPVSQIEMNTLTVPRGSNMATLTLADGSKVWLNVASSITFPTAFVGDERKVDITGEVYFEIVKKPGIPFVVEQKNSGAKVQVLGTHFNVNAYDDETSMKVSLLEGSVKVFKTGSSPVVIKPGEQAIVAEKIKVKQDADMEEVMSWKNGYFKFNKTDMATVMRQAERWYNIHVQYPNGMPKDTFSGTMARNVNLSEFVKILEYSDVRTAISGQQLIINP